MAISRTTFENARAGCSCAGPPPLGYAATVMVVVRLGAEKFGAEVAKESTRNEKIAKKSLKTKSRAYAYALPSFGRHVLAGTGPYAYAPERPMRTHQWPNLCL
ncbi:hypothetical protein PIB30_061890 [Stylosanthes scabra]|uniref:Uncharacterized protein n=1 Tax=Stylosanthes scabra TaxID=79078 RepID=A0ABU6UKG9_9FABA|nr:hypothetical protein [Stylosanthes scabra]